MKKRGRYRTAAEIEAAIDRAKARAMRWAKEAEALDGETEQLRKAAWLAQERKEEAEANRIRSDMGLKKELANKLWSRQRTTNKKTIPMLSRKLAEFRTETMFGMAVDLPK